MTDHINSDVANAIGAPTSQNVIPFALHQQKRRIQQEPFAAEHYYNLALMLDPTETIVIEGPTKRTVYTKKTLLIDSFRLNPDNPFVLNNLANLLGAGEFVKLPRGHHSVSYSKIELLQQALRLDPTYANAYCNLAVAMQQEGLKNLRVRIRGVAFVVTARELFGLAILEDPNHALAYNNLALTFQAPNETCRLVIDGKDQEFTEQDLYVRSIACDASHADPFYNLSTLIRHDHPPITLSIDGVPHAMSKRDLLIKAISLNAQYGNAYYNLANVLLDEGVTSAELCIDGETTEYNPKMLNQKAIECNDNNAMAFYNLALLLGSDEKVSIMVGGQKRLYTKRLLNLAALERAPSFAGSYINLAAQLRDPEETVSVTINKEKLQLKQSDLLKIAAALQ